MLKSWPISRRVNTGFVIVTLMLMGLALFSHRAVGALGNVYDEYQAIAHQNIAINTYIEDIYEARQASFRYRITPDTVFRAHVNSNIDELLNGTEFLASFAGNPERLSEIQTIFDEGRIYKTQFNLMANAIDATDAWNAICLSAPISFREETRNGLQACPAIRQPRIHISSGALPANALHRNFGRKALVPRRVPMIWTNLQRSMRPSAVHSTAWKH